MPIIGYSPWNDAANFGQGVGQSLSESLLQLPMQRYALAAQQARMQQAQQMGLARLAETAARNQELGQYHQGQLGLGQNKLEQEQQMAQMANMLKALQVQNEQLRTQMLGSRPISLGNGSYLTPGGGGGQGSQDQGQQLPPMPSGIGNVPGLMGQSLQNTMPPIVPSPQGQGQTQQQLGGQAQGGWQLNRVPQQESPYQQQMADLARRHLYMLGRIGATNMPPDEVSNVVYNPNWGQNQQLSAPQQPGTNRWSITPME
jgi:hypothetical protein